jgi:hypothetical protein
MVNQNAKETREEKGVVVSLEIESEKWLSLSLI